MKLRNVGHMKEIFVISSYAKSPEQVDILASMIGYLTKTNRDICLVSHLPIPERLVNDNVKFTVLDSNNILGPPLGGAYWQFLDMKVQFNPANFYHGAAVYSNLYNALKLLAGRYEWVHFVESDLDAKDVQKYLDEGFAQHENNPDLSVIGYALLPENPASSPVAIVTDLFSLRPQIVDLLPLVSSWNDYERLSAGNLVILEGFLMNQFKARNIKCALLRLDAQLVNKTRLGNDHMAFKCRQNNQFFTVFVINRSPFEITVKTNSGHDYRLKPGHVFYAHDISASDELHVIYIESQKVFHHPVAPLRMGAFKKQGANLCPDWIEDVAMQVNLS
jgi:hypothetical protein